jgi:hypothetical protein
MVSFALLPAYRAELAARKLMGPAERRNKLLPGWNAVWPKAVLTCRSLRLA